MGRASGDSGHVVAYLSSNDGPTDIRLGGDYGWGRNHVARQLAAFSETESDAEDSNAAQLFGDPDAVFADLFIIRDNSKVDDYMEVLLYYPGLRVRIKSSYLVREPLPAYSVFGHKGTFIKIRGDVQEKHLLAGDPPIGDDWGVEPVSGQGLLHTEIDGKVIRERVPTEKGSYMDYFNGMYEAIRNNAPLPVTAEQGVRIIRVIEKAYQSRAEKKIVPFK